uniref:Uncharacterized protein n=1 Tax=Fagus sylvatica TaxID=28930 RepID=A0A2N9IW40_FAGSY
MVMMFAAAGGDVVRGRCGCGCVGAGGFVAIWIQCRWVCVAVGLGLGLGEMVMMFAAAGGDVVRGGCGCGRLVLPWVWEVGVGVGVAVGLGGSQHRRGRPQLDLLDPLFVGASWNSTGGVARMGFWLILEEEW